MFTSRASLMLAFAAAICFTLGSPVLPSASAAQKKGTRVQQAAQELKNAHESLGNNSGKASQHLTTAISHIEAAIKTHAKSQQKVKTANNAKAGKAHHHPLHEALHAAKEAEKHLASGNTALAKSEIAKAQHHLQEFAQHAQKKASK